MRRLRVGGQTVGRVRKQPAPVRRRAMLSFDAYRLQLEDGRVSVCMFVKISAEQLAVSFTDNQNTKMIAVPAYEEEIVHFTKETDMDWTAIEDWPEGRRTRLIYFGFPRK